MRQRRKKKTEVRVQLFINSFRCHPDEVTRILGLTPTKTWVKGDPYLKTGGPVHRGDGWSLSSGLPPATAPEEQVESLTKLIRPHTEKFKRLPRGSVVDLSCAIYAYDDSQRVFFFPVEAVKTLAAIGSYISIAYYDFTNLPPEEKPRRKSRRKKRRRRSG